MKVLLSIKPKYAFAILAGEKLWELRKVIWKKRVDTIVLYASAPFSKVIGEFTPAEEGSISPQGFPPSHLSWIWWKTADKSGVSWEEFKAYFKGASYGYAIMVSNPVTYEYPKPLSDYGIKRPPQNFMYLDEEHVE